MSTKRPPIPDPDMRQIRQRCFFGCVLCGLPLYEYDHLDGWTQTKVHDAYRITLLCDKHHTERTKGLLPKEKVEEANRNPFNARAGAGGSTPYALHFGADSAVADVGGNIGHWSHLQEGQTYCALTVDGESIVSFRRQDGHLLLSLNIANAHGVPLLTVLDNEMTYAVDVWDVEFVGTTLIIRSALRKISLELNFCPPNRISIHRARFPSRRGEVTISTQGVHRAGITVSGNVCTNAQIAMAF